MIRTVFSHVNSVEARKLVFLVLEDAQGDFLGGNSRNLPLRNNFFNTDLNSSHAIVKS